LKVKGYKELDAKNRLEGWDATVPLVKPAGYGSN